MCSKTNACGQFLEANERAIGQRSKINEITAMPKESAASVKLAVAEESSSSRVLARGKRDMVANVFSAMEGVQGKGGGQDHCAPPPKASEEVSGRKSQPPV